MDRSPSHTPGFSSNAALPAPDALDRYLSGEGSAEEVRRVQMWIDASEERRAYVDGLKTLEYRNEESASSIDALWSAMALRLGQQDTRRLARSDKNATRAVLIAVTTAALGVLVFFGIRGGNRLLTTAPSAHVYATTTGQQATATLADGSQVLLGPATTLSVTTRPADANVDVHITGQALFTVRHHPARTFRVYAGSAMARVLGTTFMVRRYSTEHATQVVVLEGRMSLSGGQRTSGDRADTESAQILEAHAMGTVDDSGRVRVIPNIAVDDYVSWSTGQLLFHKTPVRDAVVELGRVYGVDIRVADSTLASQTLSWSIPVAQRSLSDVLELLVDVLDAHPVRVGRVITLVPGRQAMRAPAGSRSTSHVESQYGR